jgi:CDP-L-myo-inositol myo-inositolphosphotransferase
MIARATHRTSQAGASLDSLVDAFTNCAFLGGAGISFLIEGDGQTALAGGAAAAMQVAGLTLLGMSAWQRERVVHFDSAKAVVTASLGQTGRLLKDLTSRDFYCFALMLAAVAGGLDTALAIFAALSSLWLISVIGAAVFARARR